MTSFIFGALFAGLTLLAIGLLRTYNHYPVKELKRRARGNDPLAQLLYRPVSYGMSLQVLLWLIVGLSAALSFVLLARALETWFAVFVIGILIWIGFLWLPSASLTSVSMRLAIWLTPIVDWLLNYLHPVLRRVGDFLLKHRHVSIRTGVYEKEDIVALLEKQRNVPDNRITDDEIDLLTHALTYGDKLVQDALVPQRAVMQVRASDSIGPSLMDELYKSGYSRFPVYDEQPNNIIGTLFLRDVVRLQAKGQVKDIMRPDVFYVHEDFTLQQALQAFLKTKHHLFIVVNSFEEFVGIITIEDILEQIIGKQIVDEFDTYENMRSVAASAARKDHADRQEAAQEPTEVIE
jgi:CBS domain containing-hemolysin-like protein